MKKFFALIIVFAFITLLAGCNDIKPNTTETTGDPIETSIPTETGETVETDETESAVEVNDTPLKETDTAEVFNSVLKDERHIYFPYTGKTEFLCEHTRDTDLSINNYSIIDLNEDNVSEMVLWITHSTLGDYCAVILYYENDTVYAHAIVHRGFNSLKQDGTFHFAGGASNQGTGRIDFSGDTYTITKVAYCQSGGNNTVSYFIEDKPVSREEFSSYQEAQRAKPDAAWIEYPPIATTRK